MKTRVFKLPSNWVSFAWYGLTGDIVEKPLQENCLSKQGLIDAQDEMLYCCPIVLVEGIDRQNIIKFVQNMHSRWSYIVCKQQNQHDKAQLDKYAHYQVLATGL